MWPIESIWCCLFLMCLWLTTWDQVGSSLEKKKKDYLSWQPLTACSSSFKGGTLWDFSHLHWQVHYYHLQFLVRQPYLWDFMGIASLSRRHRATAGFLVLWLLHSSHSLFPDCTCTLGLWLHCRCINWAEVPHGHLFSLFWPMVDLCHSPHLL